MRDRPGGLPGTRLTVLRAAVIIAIDAVDVATIKSISAAESRWAGFASRKELVDELRAREGTLYRIALRFAAPDSRVKLRGETRMSEEQLGQIVGKLERMDSRSPDGAWATDTLRLISRRPRTRAADLAAELDTAKDRFKPRVRRLKELGLTESLEVGYRLTRRARVVLKHLAGRRCTSAKSRSSCR